MFVAPDSQSTTCRQTSLREDAGDPSTAMCWTSARCVAETFFKLPRLHRRGGVQLRPDGDDRRWVEFKDVLGCTDENAVQLQPDQHQDDGSCTYAFQIARMHWPATTTTLQKNRQHPLRLPRARLQLRRLLHLDVDGDGVCDGIFRGNLLRRPFLRHRFWLRLARKRLDRPQLAPRLLLQHHQSW